MDTCRLATDNVLKYLHKTILASAFDHDSYHKDALALIEGIINGEFMVCNTYQGYPSWDDWMISLHLNNKREIYDIIRELHEEGQPVGYIVIGVRDELLKYCTGKEGGWQRIHTSMGLVLISPEGAIADGSTLLRSVLQMCNELDEEEKDV